MKRLRWLAPAFLLIAAGTAFPPAAQPPAPQTTPAGDIASGPAAVSWRPFGAPAFKEAADSRRLVLLYISASWDAHDRIMSDVTYSDPGVIELLSRSYVPVRVDSDRRPDLFARYGMGAWPTTAVLLPDGQPMYYIDPNGRGTRAGGAFYPPEIFRSYFGQLASFYAENKEQVNKISAAAGEGIIAHRNAESGEIGPAMVESIVGKILDTRKERFGPPRKSDSFPDFPMVELTFDYWTRKADRKVLDVGLGHLTDLGRGGIYDQLGGGFFRYAHDTSFIVPTFEKLPSTNAEAIRAYLHAYDVTGNAIFLNYAEGSLSHVRKHGYRAADRAFTGAMSCGSRAGDTGDYYTWTEQEAQSLLTDEEMKIASAVYEIGPQGDLEDMAPRANVLYMAEGPKLLADRMGMSEKKITDVLESARAKLLAAREKRTAPPVEQATFADWSGMMISAYLTAARTFQKDEYARTALDAIDVLVSRCRNDRGLFFHVCPIETGERGEETFLQDQSYVSGALLDAFEQTGEARYLTAARGIADHSIEPFRDPISGGLSDRPADPNAPGLVSWPVRDLKDNMATATFLVRLGALTGQASYTSFARKIVESWADEAGALGEHGAPLALAAQMLIYPPLEVVIVGDAGDPAFASARRRALSLYHPWRIVRWYSAADGPAELRKRRLSPLPGAQVAFCIAGECAGPWAGTEKLRPKLAEFLNRGASGASPPPPTGEKPKGD